MFSFDTLAAFNFSSPVMMLALKCGLCVRRPPLLIPGRSFVKDVFKVLGYEAPFSQEEKEHILKQVRRKH